MDDYESGLGRGGEEGRDEWRGEQDESGWRKNEWGQNVLYTCRTLSKNGLITKKGWGWRDVGKNAYCYSRGPEISVQNQHRVAQKQGVPSTHPPIHLFKMSYQIRIASVYQF